MDSKERWRTFAQQSLQISTSNTQKFVDEATAFLERHCPTGMILTYDAMANEVDLAGVIDRIGVDRFCLSRTLEDSLDLTLHALADAELEDHCYGFRQPIESTPAVADKEVRAVLVPGVLFDRFGGRLGHGQGYYDRLLARLAPSALKIGVTGDVIVSERLPSEPHDVAMTHLLTSSGVQAVA